MDKCPPEVHGRIFYFACLDDGTTGRSLSLVSRYVREVVLPYQWQSLRLMGIDNLKGFKMNAMNFDVLRRPVYHLFIGGHSVECYGSSDLAIIQHRDFCDSLCWLLDYVSPTLETLTFHSSAFCDASAESIARIFQCHYPNLSELTVRSQCIPSRVVHMIETLRITPNSPPNLRRLHFALPCHGFSHDNSDSLRYLINSFGPDITHLRITMLDRWGSKRVAEVVHAELNELGMVDRVIDLSPITQDIPPTVTAPVVSWDPLIPESLESFVLQPSPTLDFYCSCCMELRSDLNVMRLFERLSETAKGNFFTFIPQERLLNRYSSPIQGQDTVYGIEEAMDDWHGRIRNRAGCWERKVQIERPLVPKRGESEGLILNGSSQRGDQAKTNRPLLVAQPVRKFFGKLTETIRASLCQGPSVSDTDFGI